MFDKCGFGRSMNGAVVIDGLRFASTDRVGGSAQAMQISKILVWSNDWYPRIVEQHPTPLPSVRRDNSLNSDHAPSRSLRAVHVVESTIDNDSTSFRNQPLCTW